MVMNVLFLTLVSQIHRKLQGKRLVNKQVAGFGLPVAGYRLLATCNITHTFANFIMKSKSLKKNKVNIITLGCSKNMVDSEVLSGQLNANGIDVVHENRKIDHNIVVVNTCGFIDKAKEESVNTIMEQMALKTQRQAG